MKVLALLVLAGCSLGVGGAYVGKWRPRTQVDVDACLVAANGTCTDRKQIVTDHPARRFWGFILPFPALGGAAITHAGDTSAGVRAEASLEYLRGYGRLAWGVRSGVVLDGDTRAVPITAMGHASLTERVGVYIGAGASPYALYVPDHGPHEMTNLGGRVLAGTQLALTPVMVVSFEADSLWLDFSGGYRSLGVTGHLGFFL